MHRILCFGEVLWDLLPRGRFLGGAPLNVAYHLAQLGCAPTLVSAVGRDELGQEALAAITAAGVNASTITQHLTLATGTAEVQLDASGQAKFQIEQPVAWDEIAVEAALGQPAPGAIIFGTLALRSPANRIALTRLLNAFPEARIVCDLNLRPPFDDLALVAPLLDRCHLLKLNADEARRLCERATDAGDWREMASELARRHHGAVICITRGAEGACVLDGAIWAEVGAPRVTVRDTVGAGDAFTAALEAGWLCAGTQPDWPRILRAACSLGGFVASHDGAQPAYEDFKPEL